jgi:hypothetical protein
VCPSPASSGPPQAKIGIPRGTQDRLTLRGVAPPRAPRGGQPAAVSCKRPRRAVVTGMRAARVWLRPHTTGTGARIDTAKRFARRDPSPSPRQPPGLSTRQQIGQRLPIGEELHALAGNGVESGTGEAKCVGARDVETDVLLLRSVPLPQQCAAWPPLGRSRERVHGDRLIRKRAESDRTCRWRCSASARHGRFRQPLTARRRPHRSTREATGPRTTGREFHR